MQINIMPVDVPNVVDNMVEDSSTASVESNYVDEMEAHVEDLLEGIEKSHNVETKLEEIEEEIERLDQEILNELEDVLRKFGTYGHDMQVFITFVAKEVEKAEEQGKQVKPLDVLNDFRDELESGNKVNIHNSPGDVIRVLREIHDEMKEVFEDLKEKDEKLQEIEEMAEKVKNWDTDIEDEIGQIESMVEDAEKLSEAFKPLDQGIDPSAWD